ncbi:ectopic P granules protein 5 homolog [Amblyomma americanum]
MEAVKVKVRKKGRAEPAVPCDPCKPAASEAGGSPAESEDVEKSAPVQPAAIGDSASESLRRAPVPAPAYSDVPPCEPSSGNRWEEANTSRDAISAPVAPELPSAPVDTSGEPNGDNYPNAISLSLAGVVCAPEFPTAPVEVTGDPKGDSHSTEIKTTRLQETFPAVSLHVVPTAPADLYAGEDAYIFPSCPEYPAATPHSQAATFGVSSAVTLCGFDVLSRSKDVSRLHSEILSVLDNRTLVRPLTEDQALGLYENAWLKQRGSMITEFVSLNDERNLKHHTLYVLLASYLRSRELLTETTGALNSLQKQIAQQEAGTWDLVSASVTGQASCTDNRQVTGTHHFEKAQYNGRMASLMASSCEKLLRLLREKHVVHMHNVSTLRIQIDYYFQLVLSRGPFRHLQSNSPVSFQTKPELGDRVSELKSCISVLFSFLRKRVKDEVFLNEVRSWVCKLSSLLLRVASLADHFFLLNHVLWCPPGFHKWAIGLVQMPSPPLHRHLEIGLRCYHVDYTLAALATILSPVQHLQNTSVTTTRQVLCKELNCEDDIVALMNQVPFSGIWNHLFELSENSDAKGMPKLDVLKVIALASHLVAILGTGLKTYSSRSYKQLTKTISFLIHHTVHCVSNHWSAFQLAHSRSDTAILTRLQLEYDHFFLRAVNTIFSSEDSGAWQFMADLPFDSVSVAMRWQLIWALHNSYQKREQQVHLPPSDICKELLCASHRLSFEEVLSRATQSDVLFLLTALANMADGVALTHVIALEIFEVTYLNQNFREVLAKEGRNLLSSLAQKQPCIVSVLLDAIQDNMMALDTMSCHLMQVMPLQLWQPDKEDLDVIAHFLLYYPLDSPQSFLARLLIDRLNYGITEQGQLFLERSLHQFLGILLLEAYEKLCTGYVDKQARYLYHVATGTYKSVTPAEFVAWLWNILFKLRLHAFDTNHQAQLSLVVDENPLWGIAPNLQDYEWLQSICKASETVPYAAFLSLSIGRAGHYREEFLVAGFKSISTLVLNKQYAAAIKCVSNILPLFYMRQEMLVTNQQFLTDLQQIVLADSSSQTSTRLVDLESGRCVLRLLAATMARHVQQAKCWGFPSLPIRLWVSLLFSLPGVPMLKAAHKAKGQTGVMYLVDTLVQLAHFEGDCLESVLVLLSELLASVSIPAGPQSMKTWPAMVPFRSEPAFPWFALAGMIAEARLPTVTTAWNAALVAVTRSTRCTAEVKKAMQAPLDVLLLYRWAHQAVLTDAGHPALILIWQQFFSQYLQLCPDGISAGPRLFEGGGYSSLLKKLKQRLVELEKYFSLLCSRTEVKGAAKVLHERLLTRYRSFRLWLEESHHLLNSSRDISTLPSRYCPNEFCATVQGTGQLWHDLVPVETWKYELKDLELLEGLPASHQCKSQHQSSEKSSEKHLVSRFKTYENPATAPRVPTMNPVIPPLPVIASEVRTLVLSQLHKLQDQASTVTGQLQRLAVLDSECREKLLPMLYKNVPASVSQTLYCGSECKGAVRLKLHFFEAHQDPNVLRKIKQNRTEWLATVTEPPYASCCAFVHLEACLTHLVQRHRQASPTDKVALQALGAEVFFDLVQALYKGMADYAPTRQFLTLCLDMVGEEFVSNRANQCLPVLRAMLRDPSAVGHLAPFFTPAAADDDQYSVMYQAVSSRIVPNLYAVVFVLLSKFALPSWLKSRARSQVVRKELLKATGEALYKCGFHPVEPLLPLVELLHSHLHSLVLFNFPQHYAFTLDIILRGSSSCSIPVATWSIFLQALGYRMPANAAQAHDEEYAKHQHILSPDEVAGTLNAVTVQFTTLRTTNTSVATDGLYGRLRPYMHVLSRFFSLVIHCYLWEKVKSPKDDLQEAAKSVLHLYGPWLELAEGKSTCVPWMPENAGEVSLMADSLVGAIAFFHRCCHGVWNVNVMSLVWQHYFVKYVWTSPPQYIADSIQAALVRLPWLQFSPTPEDLRLACKLLVEKYSGHLSFLVQVFVKVPWQVCLLSARQLPPDLCVDYYSSFAELVLGLTWRPDMAMFVSTALKPLCKLDWGVLPVELVWRLQKVFASSCDVHQLLKQNAGIDGTALEFVVALSCMLPGQTGDPHKQHTFVSMLVGLYSSALDVADTKDVARLLPQLLDRCQSVQGPVALLGCALSVLDSCHDDSPQAQALLEGLLSWLNARPGHPILLTVLAAACINVASMPHLVRMTEACLTAFLQESTADDGGWHQAAAVFRVPELTLAEFQEQCACQAGHLTELCYVLHCLPQCRCPEDERGMLDQLFKWVSRGCAPGCASGENEPKLLLLWAKLLVLGQRQLEFGSCPQVVCQLLAEFCSMLAALGEDRETGGLLGALGMGRRSPSSPGFRVCCRAVSAFVAARIGEDNVALASQTLTRLQAVQVNKAYSSLWQEVKEALGIVQDSTLTLRDSLRLILKLADFLYRDKAYIRILNHWQLVAMPTSIGPSHMTN